MEADKCIPKNVLLLLLQCSLCHILCNVMVHVCPVLSLFASKQTVLALDEVSGGTRKESCFIKF